MAKQNCRASVSDASVFHSNAYNNSLTIISSRDMRLRAACKGLTWRRTPNNRGLEFIERNNVIKFCNLLFRQLMLTLDLYL